MSYLNSDIVNVFPASLRTYNGKGKYTTENNLTGIVLSIVDRPSYVITRGELGEGSRLEFVLKGYFFSAEDVSGLGDFANLWAGINIENTNEYSRLLSVMDSTELDTGISENREFKGVYFANSESTPDVPQGANITDWLHITDANGNIINNAKFDPESIGPGEVNPDGSHNTISEIWVDGALHLIELVDGKYRYVNRGRFERSADGNLGFSQPVYFKDGKPEAVNTIFWGDSPTPSMEIEGAEPHSASIGDIFLGFTTE